MKVLIVGQGGREHALAWAADRSPQVTQLVVYGANPAMSELGSALVVDGDSPAAIADAIDREGVDLTIVGPEAPLVDGLADEIRARGRLVLGPNKDGARLEGSKAWMKQVLADAGVPTAAHAAFSAGDEAQALAYLDQQHDLFIVKTDGLAAGKGVIVTESRDEAEQAVRDYLSGDAFGDAGRTLVIEEGLTGPEVSLLVLCDGNKGVPLTPAQDFKRAYDGGTGPNTGGMGAYSPVPIVDDDLVAHAMDTIVEPTIAQLHKLGIDYRGVLYAGLMLTPDGPKILEYNVRFGDPEAQVVIPRFASDLMTHLAEAAAGSMLTPVRWKDSTAVTVVLAAEGYPASPVKGAVIEGLSEARALDDVLIFEAGTADVDGNRVVAGGRVLNVTGLGPTIEAARTKAYEAASKISWPGMQMRTDIAADL
ncbi:MAG: phosphoribosylamine--glycine ligase [Acidimicrobiia bacterium]|nr:phosphoribosylamine--glycine ligase [Acidimicrobiia bacterium]